MAAMGFALFVLGIIFIILYPVIKKKNKRCSAQTQGIVDEIRNVNKDGTDRDYFVYSYHVDGIEYQLKTYERSPEANKAGDHCTIWYNPAKSKEAQAARASKKFLKIILIIGIVMVVLGVILFFLGL